MTSSKDWFRKWFTEPRPDHRRRQFFVVAPVEGCRNVYGPYTWGEAYPIGQFHEAQGHEPEAWTYDELMDNDYWSEVLEDDQRFKT